MSPLRNQLSTHQMNLSIGRDELSHLSHLLLSWHDLSQHRTIGRLYHHSLGLWLRWGHLNRNLNSLVNSLTSWALERDLNSHQLASAHSSQAKRRCLGCWYLNRLHSTAHI